jgi:hypothetical protein
MPFTSILPSKLILTRARTLVVYTSGVLDDLIFNLDRYQALAVYMTGAVSEKAARRNTASSKPLSG